MVSLGHRSPQRAVTTVTSWCSAANSAPRLAMLRERPSTTGQNHRVTSTTRSGFILPFQSGGETVGASCSHRPRRRLDEMEEIVGAAGLGSGARQAEAAKGLAPTKAPVMPRFR